MACEHDGPGPYYVPKLMHPHYCGGDMNARDELFEQMGKSAAYGAAQRERERMIAALIRGEAQIAGARIRIEWIDPKPDWVDEWVDRVEPRAQREEKV